MSTFKTKMKKLWDYFTTYELCWLISIIGLSIVVTILFPSEAGDLSINPAVIMGLYFLDVLFNVICELLISKQSRWNFIVSLLVEITEIITCIVIAERFATMAVTIFFWIPVDIISFINWNKHKDKEEDELTVVRTLKGWQEILIIAGIALWTVGVGYLLTIISPDGLLEANSKLDIAVCYIDAAVSAVGICNGLFILFRFREQWIAWYICTILETIINIMMGQWVLLVLKAGYLTNTTYGYIKWTKYIKDRQEKKDKETTSEKDKNAGSCSENCACCENNCADNDEECCGTCECVEDCKADETENKCENKEECCEHCKKLDNNDNTEETKKLESKEKEGDIIGAQIVDGNTLDEGIFEEDDESEDDLISLDDVN